MTLKKIKQTPTLIAVALMMFSIESCVDKTKTSDSVSSDSNRVDSLNHGYNELANPDNKKTLTISDYSQDNPEIKNVERPKTSVQTSLDTGLLFGIWTLDPEGPHADFVLSGKSFLVVDYDGDGAMPYELKDKKLKVFYNDFVQEGNIISIDKNALNIVWKDVPDTSEYVRWKL